MKTILARPILAGLIWSAFTFGAPHAQAQSSLVCPVTHLPIASPKVAVGKSIYKAKTYYFCTTNCKRLFDKNPRKYAKLSK